jgi:hypothetical protein
MPWNFFNADSTDLKITDEGTVLGAKTYQFVPSKKDVSYSIFFPRPHIVGIANVLAAFKSRSF